MDQRCHDEAERLRWVRACRIDDLAVLPEFQAIAEHAARVLSSRIAIVTVATAAEHVFIANHGGKLRKAPRRGLCDALVEGDREQVVVLDATADPRCRESPWVVGPPHLRFYAGAALRVNGGVHIGTIAVVDDAPRKAFTAQDARTLAQLAQIASAMLSQRCATQAGLIAADLVNATAIATVATDSKGVVTLWNDGAEALFGWPQREIVGRPVDVIMPERFRPAHAAGITRAENGSRLSGAVVDLVGLHRDGREFPISLSMTSWHGDRGVEFGAQIKDISDRKARDAELHHRASHDHLTGLLNRATFKAQVVEALENGAGATLLFIDVDGLKIVNDTLGHAVGDTLLQTFALRITGALPEGATAARMGGDEFAVLIPGRYSLLEARAVAALIVGEDLMVGGEQDADLAHGCSIGVAAAPLHAATAGELIARADLAMLAAKQQGGRRVRLFDNAMLNRVAARQRLDDELLLATKRGEWELHYQPQFDLYDGGVTGAEALLRWRHPERGLVLPAAFMTELEQHLSSLEVGRWVLDEACRQLRRWRDRGLFLPRISVNLFDAQFRRSSLVADVSRALEEHALSPGELELEVTERIALNPSDAAVGMLRHLREAGVHVAFDDFGTGYASLTTIKQLPLSRLKIDRSFVHDIVDNRGSAAIVEAIAAISQALDLDVVAEGIERPEQLQRLRAAGCRHGQGYLLGRPAGAADFERTLRLAGEQQRLRRA